MGILRKGRTILEDLIGEEAVKVGTKYAKTGFDTAAKRAAPVRDAIRNQPLVKTFFKSVDPTIANAGTGLRMKVGWGIGLALGAPVAGAGAAAWDNRSTLMRNNASAAPVIPGGNIPALDYDASPNGTQAGDKTLGATGALVFGLNSGRHG